jgi:hypothetical protein
MWIGKGPFDSYGYQKSAYVKGQAERILPTLIYQVQDRDPPQSQTQYWVVPVDHAGNENGPIAFKADGRAMYGYWERWKNSETAVISNFFSG